MSSYFSAYSASTSTGLLEQVRQRNGEAWSRLARLYTPLVYRWARQCGLQSSDAADVAQEVFLSVAANMDGFRKSDARASFRGWLWTIARNQIRLHFRRQKDRPQATGGTDAYRALGRVPDAFVPDAFVPDAFVPDDEPSVAVGRDGLVHRALELIRQDFQEQTWQAFLLVTLHGRPATEVAAELGMAPAAVRQAKYRVLCRLHDELERC